MNCHGDGAVSPPFFAVYSLHDPPQKFIVRISHVFRIDRLDMMRRWGQGFQGLHTVHNS